MLPFVMHVVFITQNLESTGKHSQETGNLLWVRMVLFHAITTAKPTRKLWHECVENTKSGTTVDKRNYKTISNNRHYLKIIIEVLLVCSQQEITLRGHRESLDSLNRGNFLD